MNDYKEAFENWLIDNKLRYVSLDEKKRWMFAQGEVKTFDFFLYRAHSVPVVVEVKGRKFKGTSLAGLSGLECWVTMDDIRGLIQWRQILTTSSSVPNTFGMDCDFAFIFAYKLEKVDVETDGRDIYDFRENSYVFFAVRLDDYREFMTVRSPKWQTVTLPAAGFRQLAMPALRFLTGED